MNTATNFYKRAAEAYGRFTAVPQSVLDNSAEALNESDSVLSFLTNGCERTTNDIRTSAAELHKAYVNYCKQNGFNSPKRAGKSFGTALLDNGIERIKLSSMFYLGIIPLPQYRF